MKRTYEEAAEYAWWLLEQQQAALKPLTAETVIKVCPWDTFTALNPTAKALSQQAQDFLDYELSERQLSWAVMSFSEARANEAHSFAAFAERNNRQYDWMQ
jgi:hypothetical protein